MAFRTSAAGGLGFFASMAGLNEIVPTKFNFWGSSNKNKDQDSKGDGSGSGKQEPEKKPEPPSKADKPAG